MPDPVFSAQDRVPNLPPELQGKSPAEVAAYYQNREVQITTAAERAIAMAGAGEPTQQPTQQPQPQVRTPEQQQTDANFVSRSEWNQMAPVVQKGLITQAKTAASQGKPYWSRFAADIEKTVSACDPMLQMQEDIWVTAYNEIVGRNYQVIQQEEAAARQAAASITVEPPSGGFTPAELTRPLDPGEARVAAGLGLSAEAYRKGQERLATNRFPVTLDNRGVR